MNSVDDRNPFTYDDPKKSDIETVAPKEKSKVLDEKDLKTNDNPYNFESETSDAGNDHSLNSRVRNMISSDLLLDSMKLHLKSILLGLALGLIGFLVSYLTRWTFDSRFLTYFLVIPIFAVTYLLKENIKITSYVSFGFIAGRFFSDVVFLIIMYFIFKLGG